MNFKAKIPLAPHTTLKVGGPAEWFIDVKDQTELTRALAEAKAKDIPVRVIGGGSNILVPDRGVPGLVLKLSTRGWEVVSEDDKSVLVKAAAGETLDRFVAWSVSEGYWGIENLSHIPGSVGATVIQNVGAYGVEVKDLVTKVAIINRDTLETKNLSNQDCQFSYRDSFFKTLAGGREIVTEVFFRLSKTPTPVLEYKDLLALKSSHKSPSQDLIRETIINIRSEKFPDWHQIGTAGSFFKNPIISESDYEALKGRFSDLPAYEDGPDRVKIPLGYVLDKILNLRGVRAGNVGTFAGQALVIISYSGATTQEIDAFANNIAKQVLETTGLTVEREVTSF